MVINNRIHSTNITEKVFWYKAKERDQFKIGCNKFINFHKNNYDPDHDKRIPFINLKYIANIILSIKYHK